MTQILGMTAAANTGSRTAAQVLRLLAGRGHLTSASAEDARQFERANWAARSVEKGSSIFDQGDERGAVSVLLSGWAFRYQSLPDGKRQILDFIFAGALLGFGSGAAHSYGVETVTPCVTASLPYPRFRRLLSSCPSLAVWVADRVSEGELRAHQHMTSLGRRSARERVAALIIELAERTGVSGAPSARETLDLPVTQMMIGDALGLSNEHVCRTLGKLADDGVIALGRHTLNVLKPEALARVASVDAGEYACPENRFPVAA